MSAFNPLLVEVPQALETERLLIASPQPGLGPLMSVAIAESHGQLSPWLPWAQQVPDIEDAEGVVRQQMADFISRKDLRYQIFDRAREGRRFLGGIGLLRIDWKVRRFEIGYWIRASAQGQGYVTEAVLALTTMAFEQLGARRVEIRMHDVNLKSRAVAERCGFELEGVLRNYCVYARVA